MFTTCNDILFFFLKVYLATYIFDENSITEKFIYLYKIDHQVYANVMLLQYGDVNKRL